MKSVDTLFNEALAALDEVGKRSQFEEKLATTKKRAGRTPSIETQLNIAETTLKESAAAKRYFPKHNGREETITESGGYQQTSNTPRAKNDAKIYEALIARGECTAEQARIAQGQPPAAYASLSEAKKQEYRFARSVGISEVDALRLTTITSVGRNR